MDQRRVTPRIEVVGDSDCELVHRFVRSGDEQAFRQLVLRYHALVLGVCTRVLRHRHLAEDAYQSTFLTLVQRAGTIRQRDAIASWLYGVAYRIAWRIQRREARRMHRSTPLDPVLDDDPLERMSRDYEAEVLDDELRRLPEALRLPLLLRYQLNLSNSEVAQRLRLSVAAVEGRLKRARSRLRYRLARQGISLGTVLGLISVGTATETATAASTAVAPLATAASSKMALVDQAVRLAAAQRMTHAAAASSQVPLHLQALMEQEIWHMAICKSFAWLIPAAVTGVGLITLASLSPVWGQLQGTGAGGGASKNAADVVALAELEGDGGSAPTGSAPAAVGVEDPFAAPAVGAGFDPFGGGRAGQLAGAAGQGPAGQPSGGPPSGGAGSDTAGSTGEQAPGDPQSGENTPGAPATGYGQAPYGSPRGGYGAAQAPQQGTQGYGYGGGRYGAGAPTRTGYGNTGYGNTGYGNTGYGTAAGYGGTTGYGAASGFGGVGYGGMSGYGGAASFGGGGPAGVQMQPQGGYGAGGYGSYGPYGRTAGPAGPLEVRSRSEVERRLVEVMDSSVEIEYVDTPLQDVVSHLHDTLSASSGNLPIRIDRQALEDVGVAPDFPVTIQLKEISLRSALSHILAPLSLDAMIDNEVLVITSREEVENHRELRFYRLPTSMASSNDPSQLMELVRLVDPDAFEAAEARVQPVSTERFTGIAVRTNPRIHQEILELLKDLD